MPTLSTPPDAARLAFTLELTGWESYPVDEHGQFMTDRSPEERAAAPFKFSAEAKRRVGTRFLRAHGYLNRQFVIQDSRIRRADGRSNLARWADHGGHGTVGSRSRNSRAVTMGMPWYSPRSSRLYERI